MATLLLSRGVQGVEVVEAVAGVANSDEGLRKLDGLLHFGLLEPHVRPPSYHALLPAFCLLFLKPRPQHPSDIRSACVNFTVSLQMQKRFQNSVSIFQKRRADCSPWEPLYSWTP